VELSSFLAGIISIAGLFAGIIIGLMTKEEIKPGKKYFLALQSIFLSITLLMTAFFYNYTIAILVSAAVLAILLLKQDLLKNNLAAYSIMGLLFIAGAQKNILAVSIPIFLYGLPAGTLISEKKGWARQAALPALAFIIISSVVQFI